MESLKLIDFIRNSKVGQGACHAGGREFDSRRSRHNKNKDLEIFSKSFFYAKFFIPNTIPNILTLFCGLPGNGVMEFVLNGGVKIFGNF